MKKPLFSLMYIIFSICLVITNTAYSEKIKSSEGKKDLFINKEVLEHQQLDANGGIEEAENRYTNRIGIPVKEGKYYCVEYDGMPTPVLYMVFKSKNKLNEKNSSIVQDRISSKVFVKAPKGAKFLFFTAYESDFSKISVYEGFSHSNPLSNDLWTNGKKLMTLGDSTSEQDLWQAVVLSKMGFNEYINLAVGGTTINVFADNVTSDNLKDVDVVTIMGFFNNGPIKKGSIDDKPSNNASDSVCAQYKYIIDKLLTLKPSINIILITPHCPRADDCSEKVEAVKNIAMYYNLPCIDLYNEAGFNEFTFDLYLRDAVHSSQLGYYKEAQVIVGGMLRYLP